MSNIYVGIDPSLSSTGLYIIKEQGKNLYWQIDTSPKDYVGSINRCLYISDIIVQAIQDNIDSIQDVKLITIQDYFTGRQPGVVIQLAQLGTLIRYRLLDIGFPVIVSAPKKIKKFVTGNGNAKKPQMMNMVLEKYGFKASTDNLADACGMAYFAKFVYDIWNGLKISEQETEFFKFYLTPKCVLKIK